jgi:hypothetical protein
VRWLQATDVDIAAILAANGNNVINCVQTHPVLGLAFEDTWGWPEWTRWWPRYHAAGGQHHLGDPWPDEPPPRTSPEQDAAAALTGGTVLIDDARDALLSLLGGLVVPPQHDVRRAQQANDLALVRLLLQRCREDLRALPPPAQRTALQREQAFIRRGLLVIARVLLNGIWTPVADDFDETGATEGPV